MYFYFLVKIINTLVQGGLSWDKINKMISDGRKEGDPLANMIMRIDWPENEVYFILIKRSLYIWKRKIVVQKLK